MSKKTDIYQKIAIKLTASDWKSVFDKLDNNSKKKLFKELDVKKEILKKRKAAEKKSGAKSPKSKGTKEQKENGPQSRKTSYRFGSRNLQVIKPSKGYPDKKTAKRAVEGKLKLMYAHGYSGNFDESRQNICLSSNGNKLIYYIAAIAVVYDLKNNTQSFFTKHNDDLTSYVICI